MIFELSTGAIDQLASSRLAMARPELVEALRHPMGWSTPHGVAAALARVSLHVDDWWAIHDTLRGLATVESGATGKERLAAQRAQHLVERLGRVIGDLTNHPGYRDIGVPGRDPHVLEAHQIDGDARWWPSRRQALLGGAQAGIDSTAITSTTLHPRVVKVRGRSFTRWVVQPNVSAKNGLTSIDPSSIRSIASP